VRGLGGAGEGESSVGATVDATGSGHALAIACKVPRQRAHGSGCTAGAPGTPAGSTVHEARFDGRPAGAARGPQCFRFVYPRRGLLDR
jgi:hypothetical protein